MEPGFENIIGRYNSSVSELATYLREYLHQILGPDIIELPDMSANIIGYGYGPGYKDMICAIIPSKKGIKLGINGGSTLPDPEKILKGTGKVHRYVEIAVDTMSNPALKKLLMEAQKSLSG